MYPIDTDTATDENEFTDGDESQSIPPTDLNAAWFNHVQRELLNILEGTGISPDATNDAQIWSALQKFGIKTYYSDAAEIDVSDFTGANVVFHTAADFELVGTLKNQSLIIIVPFWNDSSPSSIGVSYGADTLSISKYCGFIGFAANGLGDLDIAGVRFPLIKGTDNSLNVRGLNAGFVKSDERYETNLVQFAYSTDAEELQDFQVWQLFENWKVNQVKRVYCTNAQASGTPVPVYYASGSYKNVYFYEGCFREFLCVGSYTSGDYTWAILLADCKRN